MKYNLTSMPKSKNKATSSEFFTIYGITMVVAFVLTLSLPYYVGEGPFHFSPATEVEWQEEAPCCLPTADSGKLPGLEKLKAVLFRLVSL